MDRAEKLLGQATLHLEKADELIAIYWPSSYNVRHWLGVRGSDTPEFAKLDPKMFFSVWRNVLIEENRRIRQINRHIRIGTKKLKAYEALATKQAAKAELKLEELMPEEIQFHPVDEWKNVSFDEVVEGKTDGEASDHGSRDRTEG